MVSQKRYKLTKEGKEVARRRRTAIKAIFSEDALALRTMQSIPKKAGLLVNW